MPSFAIYTLKYVLKPHSFQVVNILLTYKIVHCFDLGQDVSTGQIVDHEGVGIKHVTGVGILDNYSVNLLSSLLTAVFVPRFAVSVWDGL